MYMKKKSLKLWINRELFLQWAEFVYTQQRNNFKCAGFIDVKKLYAMENECGLWKEVGEQNCCVEVKEREGVSEWLNE